MLEKKKLLVAKRISAQEEQETAKAQAVTEATLKEIQRVREVTDVQISQEKQIITEQSKVWPWAVLSVYTTLVNFLLVCLHTKHKLLNNNPHYSFMDNR
jgi:PAB1-binding protein PBP1